MPEILIIDDDENLCETLSIVLEAKGHKVVSFQSGEKGIEFLKDHFVDLILLDLFLKGMDGLAILERIKEIEKEIPVIVITGNREIPTVIKAIKSGAFHYLPKPFTNDELMIIVEQTVREKKIAHELGVLKESLKTKQDSHVIIGKSAIVKELFQQLETVAPTNLTVILQGESGTGKEVFAQLLHQKSLRPDQPFIPIDCGALPETLVEREFFGHEKGAFTGADQRKLGIFEMALEGTLFLDEITNLPLTIQPKFLRVLQEKRIRRIGGQKDFPVNPRIIVASNQELEKAVQLGHFREDLYYRLNQFTIFVPPLRERVEDIPEFIKKFIENANKTLHKNVTEITEDAIKFLQSYEWPGNIRELKNVILKCVLNSENIITIGEVKKSMVTNPKTPFKNSTSFQKETPVAKTKKTAKVTLKEYSRNLIELEEKKKIAEQLDKNQGKKDKTAKILGISRKTLYNKMRKYHLLKKRRE